MTRKKDLVPPKLLILILISLAFIIASYLLLNLFFNFSCHIIGTFSADKYCYGYYNSNYTNSLKSYVLRSHLQDQKDALDESIRRLKLEKEIQLEQECYNKGFDYNKSFDIQLDYNLSCTKLDYINNHLIDVIKEGKGGYISGHYSALLSHRNIEGRFNIVQRSLATGKLVKSMSGHINCRNETSNAEIRYYDESEFVLYYTERCLQ